MTVDDLTVDPNRYREIPSSVPGARMFMQMGSGCSVIVAVEGGAWHLSIAHRHRYPKWNSIAKARYDLLPADVTMAMLLPPIHEYVNIHENCFHLWQIDAPSSS